MKKDELTKTYLEYIKILTLELMKFCICKMINFDELIKQFEV